MNKKLIRCNAKYKNTKQNQYFSNNANHQPKAPSIHWSKNEVAEKKKKGNQVQRQSQGAPAPDCFCILIISCIVAPFHKSIFCPLFALSSRPS